MHKWNIFKVTPAKKRRKFNWNRIPWQAGRGAERRPLLMLRWFFYIFSLLYILCNLYVCTRRIRNGCVWVCVCNYFFIYIRLFYKKLYEYANANAARAAFAICLLFFVSFLAFSFLFECLPIVFYSPLFLRSTCKFREHSAKNNVHCFMWPTVCAYIYRMRPIKYLTHEILNKLNFLPKNHNKNAA